MVFARQLEPEVMDQPGLDAAEHARALAGLARINFFSNSAGIVWGPLRALARSERRKISVLDIACGGGDVLRALARRAEREGLEFEWHGCDVSATALEFARERTTQAKLPIKFFQAGVFSTPLPRPFDVVMCSLFLHHLREEMAVKLMQIMDQGAMRLCVINDLERCRGGLVLAALAPRLLSRSAVVHTDALRSVRGAWTITEAVLLAHQAGLPHAKFTAHWPCRWRMIWEPSKQT